MNEHRHVNSNYKAKNGKFDDEIKLEKFKETKTTIILPERKV